ncbi:hypothetical protein COO60DRAFT_1529312 [Scenedesmus sp. NREL 46B-D3]|nr:hypothetical protein COO60DRAFT_1529312 [Scenedesmus sp. NREL 46B-D3]
MPLHGYLLLVVVGFDLSWVAVPAAAAALDGAQLDLKRLFAAPDRAEGSCVQCAASFSHASPSVAEQEQIGLAQGRPAFGVSTVMV